jgi:hypothetical protein
VYWSSTRQITQQGESTIYSVPVISKKISTVIDLDGRASDGASGTVFPITHQGRDVGLVVKIATTPDTLNEAGSEAIMAVLAHHLAPRYTPAIEGVFSISGQVGTNVAIAQRHAGIQARKVLANAKVCLSHLTVEQQRRLWANMLIDVAKALLLFKDTKVQLWHMDLYLRNIMLEADASFRVDDAGVARIVDFGRAVAQWHPGDTDVALIGTGQYILPECPLPTWLDLVSSIVDFASYTTVANRRGYALGESIVNALEPLFEGANGPGLAYMARRLARVRQNSQLHDSIYCSLASMTYPLCTPENVIQAMLSVLAIA